MKVLEQSERFGGSLQAVTERFLRAMNDGEKVIGGSGLHQIMTRLSREAMKVTARLNQGYHEPQEIQALMEELTGRRIDDSFRMFPPFTRTAGKTSTSEKMCLSIPAASSRIRAAFTSETGR